MTWLEENQSKIEQLVNYQFKNPNLLLQAFTRRSYKEEHPTEKNNDDNEILEFVGDRSFDLVVTKALTNWLGINESNPNWNEFKKKYLPSKKTKEDIFTQIKKDLVQKQSLANIIDSLNLYCFLRLGNGDIKQNISEQKSVKEDLFEALIGAVTIDCNYNLETIEKVANKLIDLNKYFENYYTHNVDYISLIKEWADQHQLDLDFFDDWQSENNENIWNYHNEFDINLPEVGVHHFIVNNKKNKEEAKQELGKQIYELLKSYHLINQKEKVVIDPNKNPISQIYELMQLGIIGLPSFTYSKVGLDHELVWTCVITTNNKNEFNGVGNSKEEAKKNACLNYLRYLSSNN